MTAASAQPPKPRAARIASIVRLLVGALFIYYGIVKALQPVSFLKVLREYDILHGTVALNSVAAVLPWLEIFCGTLLIANIARAGTALLLACTLLCFTGAVIQRALAIGAAQHLPFCAIRFDCGCGAGEINICRKVTENAFLIALTFFLIPFPRPSKVS